MHILTSQSPPRPPSPGDTFRDPQWVSESTDSNEPYVDCDFSGRGTHSPLLSGMSSLPAPPLLHFGVVVKLKEGDLDTSAAMLPSDHGGSY